MKTFLKIPLSVLWLLLAHAAVAQQAPLQASAQASAPPMTRQDSAAIRDIVEQFLLTQTAGLPGRVTLTVGTLDARSTLPTCAAPEPFFPGASRAWGKTTVGVRCMAPTPWTVYLSVNIHVTADYMVTASALAQGQLVGPNDIIKMKGDLTMLPTGVITDPSQAVGRTVVQSLPSGSPLRQDALRSQQAVQQGQAVRLISIGTGFRVSTEGKALNNASEGQVAQARTSSGQVISGVAKAGGIVEVAY